MVDMYDDGIIRLFVILARGTTQMICPSCNTSTLDSSTTCHQCGSSLITSTVGGPKSILVLDRDVHLRIGSRIGAVLGFALFVLLTHSILESLYLDKAETTVGATIFAAVGVAVGRWLVYRHYRLNYLL
jgi:hypothetical protein